MASKVLILLVFLVVLCACSMLPTLQKKPVEKKVEPKTDSVMMTPVEETKKKMQDAINKIKGVDNGD